MDVSNGVIAKAPSESSGRLRSVDIQVVGCPRHPPLHASRSARGGPGWVDSGPLNGPLLWSHRARVAVDPAGRAGIAFAMDFQGVMSTTQTGAGGAWCAPMLVYSSTFAYIVGMASDAVGNTTLAFLDEGGTGQVVAMVGSLVTGLWNPPSGVSRTDMSVGQAKLASSASGAAILTWTSGDELFQHNVVRVSTRHATFSPWRRPRTLSPAGVEMPVPEAVAVNAAGHGIVVFSAFDQAFEVHTEYAVTN